MSELKGIVHKILEMESGTGKKGNWVKQPFVIKTTDQYPKEVCFEAWNAQAENAAHLKPGEQVTVSYNLESREYNNRYFTTARAWKIQGESGKKEFKGEEKVKAEKVKEAFDLTSDEDDLPF